MISIDFSTAISLYLFILISAVLLIWLLAKMQKDKNLSLDPKFIWFCSICTYTYINTKEEAISTCPRCGSYNKKEE
jgi:rubrerythrin